MYRPANIISRHVVKSPAPVLKVRQRWVEITVMGLGFAHCDVTLERVRLFTNDGGTSSRPEGHVMGSFRK